MKSYKKLIVAIAALLIILPIAGAITIQNQTQVQQQLPSFTPNRLTTLNPLNSENHLTSESTSNPDEQFEYYRDRILDIFNMTLEGYYTLSADNTERANTYIYALWGYENGTLTREEAQAMIQPNSPWTWFDGISLFPLSTSILESSDEEFRVAFRTVAPWAERITRVDVYLDSNSDTTSFDKSSPTVQQLQITGNTFYAAWYPDPWPWGTWEKNWQGYIDGKSWKAKWWDDGWPWYNNHYGICYHSLLLSDLCDFEAFGNIVVQDYEGFVDDWVKFVIVYEYQFYDIFAPGGAAWITCTPFIAPYCTVNLIFPLGIDDDDTTAPIIDPDTIISGIPEDDDIMETSWIYDSEVLFAIEGTIYEYDSSISHLTLAVDGEELSPYDVVYIDGKEWILLGSPGNPIGACWGKFIQHPTNRWEYSFGIVLINPGYHYGLGTHTATITATDTDDDRPKDDLTSSPVTVEFEIRDDDETYPDVDVVFHDLFWSDGQIMLPFTITAYDESGISWVVAKLGPYTVFGLGYHEVPLLPGVYTLEVWVTDNDNDRSDDTLTTYLILTVDSTPPTTTIDFDGTLGLGDWYISDVTVTLTASDDFSGVAKTEYSFDGTTWEPYTMPFKILSEGTTTIYYRSIDNMGNVEVTKTATVKIDKTDPVTTVTLDGVQGLEGWFVTDVMVTLWATDDVSDVFLTEYSFDGETWNTYSSPFPVTYKGITTVYFRSIDNAGNVEETNLVDVKIYIESQIDIDPDTLNLKSKGKWITVYITLPDGYDVNDIDISTIELRFGDGSISAAWGEVQDGILMVKFDRKALIALLGDVGDNTEIDLQIWGEVAGMVFAGSDTIRVISRGK